MGWHTSRMLGICLICWGVSVTTLAASPSPAELARLVDELDSDRYATREEAGRQLLAAGDAAIDLLATAVATGSPETAWRASAILEQIALEGSETSLVRVTDAFEQLSQGSRPGLAGAARDLRARQTKMRRDRAAVRIRALGGKLSGGGDGMASPSWSGIILGGMAVPVPVPAELVEPAVIELADDAPIITVAPRIIAVPEPEEDLKTPLPADKDEEPTPVLADDVQYFPAGPEFRPKEKADAIAEKPADEPADETPAAPRPPAPLPAPPPPALPPLGVDALAPPPPADLPPMPVREPGDDPVDEAFEAKLDAALKGAAEGPMIGAIADAFVGEEVDVLDVDGLDVIASSDAAGLLMQEVLVLDENWRGGDAGLAELADVPSIVNVSIQEAEVTDAALAHLAKLPRLADLSVRGSQITADGLRQFRLKSPQTRIYASGDAMLGINASRDGPCVLSSIYYGSGAYEAGLQQGDEILSVGGHKTRDFSDLTIAVFRERPGDKLPIEFKRDGQIKTVEIVLKDRSLVEGPRR
jgi:hypothetical protein